MRILVSLTLFTYHSSKSKQNYFISYWSLFYIGIFVL